MSGLYFYTAVIAFLSGVLTQSFFAVSIFVPVWFLVIALILSVYWRRHPQTEFAPYIIVIVIVFISSAIGLVRFQYSEEAFNNSTLSSVVGQEVNLEGVIIREPDIREKSSHLTVDVAGERVLIFADRYTSVAYGDRVSVSGTLFEPESFTSDLGRTFNYPEYLRARGILYTMSFPGIKVVASGQGNPVVQQLYTYKSSFVAALTTVLPSPAADLGLGVLLGIKQALGEDLETAFRKTGIIHIVVLSGYNVMLVVAAVMYLLSYILPLRGRVVVGVVAIILFALLVGLSATVVRASAMAVLVLAAQAFGRQYNILRALLITGVVMVLYQPYILAFDIGFQLSFMATLGLVLVAPYFETLLVAAPARVGVRQFLVATIATQIAVAPLLLFHMGEISLIAVVVNVLVLPLVPFAMLATAITGAVAILLPFVAAPFSLVAYGILMSIIYIATWFSWVPFAAVSVPAFPWFGIPILYFLIGIAVYRFWFFTPRSSEVVDVRSSVDETKDWIVEEEITVIKTITGRESSSRPVTEKANEPPIFFR